MSSCIVGIKGSASVTSSPNITPAQLKSMQHFVNNLWVYTYGSQSFGKGTPAPTPMQMAMIAQSIAQLVAYIQSISPVTLDSGTQLLLKDLTLGNPSIAQVAQAYAANPSDSSLADFTNEYLQNAAGIGADTHKWFTANPGVPYTPNTTYQGNQALDSTGFGRLALDAPNFQTVLNNYIASPSYEKLNNIITVITALQSDFGTSVPPNLDPYEMSIYAMIHTPQDGASGKSLLDFSNENDTAGIADFLGQIDPTQGNGQFIANTLSAILKGNTGEFS